MKLTEAKLKQMILEAIKNKRFQDFEIPTPDEKLRADLGDETYGKIQSLDKSQRDVMKQSFDPGYPREINRESFISFMESHGFKFNPGLTFYDHHGNDGYHVIRHMDFMRDMSLPGMNVLDLELDTVDLKSGKGKQIRYDFYLKEHPMDPNYNPDLSGLIKISNIFDLDARKPSDIETILFHIFNKEKEKIKKLIGVSK